MWAAVYSISLRKLEVSWIQEIQVVDMDIEVEFSILKMASMANPMHPIWKPNLI